MKKLLLGLVLLVVAAVVAKGMLSGEPLIRAGAADEDACWAINSMTHTSTQLSPDHAEVIARLLWGGE